MPFHLLDDPEALRARLADADVVHLHWPEWLAGADPDRSRPHRRRRSARRASHRSGPSTTSRPHDAPDDDRAYRVWAGGRRRRAPPQRLGRSGGAAPVGRSATTPSTASSRTRTSGTIMGDLDTIDRDGGRSRPRAGAVPAPARDRRRPPARQGHPARDRRRPRLDPRGHRACWCSRATASRCPTTRASRCCPTRRCRGRSTTGGCAASTCWCCRWRGRPTSPPASPPTRSRPGSRA